MTTQEILKAAREAKTSMMLADTKQKNAALLAMAEELIAGTEEILAENAKDLEASKGVISDVMLDRLALRLDKAGIRYYMLTGSVNKEKRIEMVENFQNDDVPVFCISLKAGGTGLNLTAADIVIHYDPWWNVAVQNQATDRAHRIGQTNVVNVYKLVTQGTIEEKIIDIQERKRRLAEQVLEGEGMDAISFTKEEILELLSGNS